MNRYALLFVPDALAVAGAAWLWSGDPVRSLAVIVVATPCPLLLAAPVAIISGMARAARRGVEAIDLIVISNALRALAPGNREHAGAHLASETVDRLQAEHRVPAPMIERLLSVADQLDTLPAESARAELERLVTWLDVDLLPHESTDDRELYPVLARQVGGTDPMAGMSRAHREIIDLATRYRHRVSTLPDDGTALDDVRELRRLLYGLGTVRGLYMAQEDETYDILKSSS